MLSLSPMTDLFTVSVRVSPKGTPSTPSLKFDLPLACAPNFDTGHTGTEQPTSDTSNTYRLVGGTCTLNDPPEGIQLVHYATTPQPVRTSHCFSCI